MNRINYENEIEEENCQRKDMSLIGDLLKKKIFIQGKAKKTTELQYLAEEINQTFPEILFSQACGMIKKIGIRATREIFYQILKDNKVNNKPRLFKWQVGEDYKKIKWL